MSSFLFFVTIFLFEISPGMISELARCFFDNVYVNILPCSALLNVGPTKPSHMMKPKPQINATVERTSFFFFVSLKAAFRAKLNIA